MYYTIKTLIRNVFMRHLGYPMSVWIEFLSATLWLSVFAGFVFIVTRHTDQIAGWGSAQLLILLGIWSLIDDLNWGTSGASLIRFSEMINRGSFDTFLTRPIDTQLRASCDTFNIGRLLVVFADLGLITMGIKLGGFHPNIVDMIVAVVLILFGYLITYSISLLIQSTAFWFVKVNNLWAFYEGMSWIAKYPLDIFGSVVKAISLTVIPFGVAIAFPAQALMGLLDWPWIIYAFAITIIFFIISRWFFFFALRHYSSASS